MAREIEVDINNPEIRKQVELFGSLCAAHTEMAHWFGVTVRTIENYMSEKLDDEKPDNIDTFFRVYKKAQADAKTSLRRVQMNKALEGDNTLLVWLGKQLLDQKDKREDDVRNRYVDKEGEDLHTKEDY